jgi:zinc protease
LVYSGKFDYTSENKISLDALKETLEIRLLQRLREDESGVYSPAVFVNTGKYPQSRYSFFIQFGCAPRNVDRLVASALDEINKLRTEGPSNENVNKWRVEEKTTRETELKTNSFWLRYINSQLQNKDNLNQINNYTSLLNQVTAAGLKETAVKYLSGDNYIRLVLLPEQSAR